MIRVTVIWKLLWRNKEPEDILAPEGSRVENLLSLLDAEDLQEHVLFVRNKHMTDGRELLRDGDTIIVLPVIAGG